MYNLSLIPRKSSELNQYLLVIFTVSQIIFYVGFFYSSESGTILFMLLLSMIMSTAAIVIHLRGDEGLQVGYLGKLLWFVGSLFPGFSASVCVTYLFRRQEVIEKERTWAVWPLVILLSIAIIALSFWVITAFDDPTTAGNTALVDAGVGVLLLASPMPGFAVHFDLVYLRRTSHPDLSRYNWLWVPGLVIWFGQFIVILGWIIWRIRVTSGADSDQSLSYLNTIKELLKSFPQLGRSMYERTESSNSLSNKTIKSTTTESETPLNSNGVSSTVEDYRNTAETAIEKASNAESNSDFDDAVAAYSEAISEYQAAVETLDNGCNEERTKLEDTIESTRDDLEAIRTRQEQQNEIIESIQPAERSLQEAIVAHIQSDQTVARIRFRQARDTFEDAHETIAESEDDLLTEPIEVSVNPDRELTSKTLRELSGIPKPAATALADTGIETVEGLDSSNESPWTPAAVEKLVADDSISEDVATTLTLLSWWHGDDSCTFDTVEVVESRQQQADYGFNHTS